VKPLLLEPEAINLHQSGFHLILLREVYSWQTSTIPQYAPHREKTISRTQSLTHSPVRLAWLAEGAGSLDDKAVVVIRGEPDSGQAIRIKLPRSSAGLGLTARDGLRTLSSSTTTQRRRLPLSAGHKVLRLREDLGGLPTRPHPLLIGWKG